MNKEEAKKLVVGSVVLDKKTSIEMVVKSIEVKDEGKNYEVVAIAEGNEFNYNHKDLQFTKEVREIKEEEVEEVPEIKEKTEEAAKIKEEKVVKVGRKEDEPKYQIEDFKEEYTQEEFDASPFNHKRNVLQENTVVFKIEDGVYMARTVGSVGGVKIFASNLNNAKKINNKIK